MKKEFNHKESDVLEAIGCKHDSETVNNMVRDVVRQYIEDDNIQMNSQLCELLHNKLDYEVILFLAMNSVKDKINLIELDMLKYKLKKFLEDEDI